MITKHKKIRVFDTSSGEMYYFDNLHDLLRMRKPYKFKIKYLIFMDCTGFKDDSGKDIYELDYVGIKNGQRDFEGVVYWTTHTPHENNPTALKTMGWFIDDDIGGVGSGVPLDWGDSCEILGNELEDEDLIYS